MKTRSKSIFNLFSLTALLTSLLGSAVFVTPVYAAGLVVNGNGDTTANDGVCTLREAITNANNDDKSGSIDCAAGSGADTITFADNYTITLSSSLPNITTEMFIDGTGYSIELDGASAYRIIWVSSDLGINNLTLKNGRSVPPGILGGGIFNNGGVVTVTNSTISGNAGTGIYTSGGVVTVTNSTISGNNGGPGAAGGIENGGGIVTVTNSTISGNSGRRRIGIGGGINNGGGGVLTVTNSTLWGNDGGDLFNGGTLNYTNTITFSCGNVGIIGTNTNNLNIRGSILGANCPSTLNVDPNLGPLADNGGPTQTHALLAGSPAIDAGTNTGCPATDQRGVTRPQGTTCDIGAYEVDSTYPMVTATSLVPSYTTGPSSFTVTFSENVANTGGGTGANDVENPVNYILVEEGTTAGFQTTACNSTNFVQDTQYSVDSVSYNSGTLTSSVTVNGGASLPPGSYRLFVCGTTSIVDIVGNELNNGTSDFTFNFTVLAPASPSSASSLPDTGFAPNRITILPAQSTQYAELGSIWLEIPSLGVKSEIVGVPQSAEGWNVDWLGNSIGWLNGTAFPSWEGNSVVTGHVYNANGLPGPFVNLKNLKYGEQVIVHMYGEKYIFEVQESNMVFPSNTQSALEHLEDHSYLTLITCQGYNFLNDSYLFRRVVRAVLVKVQRE